MANRLLLPLQTSAPVPLDAPSATLATAPAPPEPLAETYLSPSTITSRPPSFFFVEPPDGLRRELVQCAAICSGSSQLDAQRLDDASVLESAFPYESRMSQAYGMELPQGLYPDVSSFAAACLERQNELPADH